MFCYVNEYIWLWFKIIWIKLCVSVTAAEKCQMVTQATLRINGSSLYAYQSVDFPLNSGTYNCLQYIRNGQIIPEYGLVFVTWLGNQAWSEIDTERWHIDPHQGRICCTPAGSVVSRQPPAVSFLIICFSSRGPLHPMSHPSQDGLNLLTEQGGAKKGLSFQSNTE